MAQLVDLEDYRNTAAARRAFAPWRKRFGESFEPGARLEDLSDRTLLFLARPGEESARAFYELILGALDLGGADGFEALEPRPRLQVVDIHLFLADAARFEMMHRLGWLVAYACQTVPLVQIVTAFAQMRRRCRSQPPALAPEHPEHGHYARLTPRDREGFVRRLLPQALEAFQQRLSH